MERPREEIRRYLLAAAPGATVVSLAGDASTRRFYRVTLVDGSTRVLMDYGAPFVEETDDIRLNRVFRDAGLPVAEILDASPESGCLILEDLGDHTLEALLMDRSGRSDHDPLSLLEQAVRLAVRIAEQGTPALERAERAGGPALDAERFRFEMDYFLDKFAGAMRGCSPAPAGLREELHDLADRAARSPRRVFCHRDFHSRNLMMPERGGLVLVDIQDARWGPDAYDLASLLRDAYAEIDENWIEPLIGLYLSGLSKPPDPESFRRRFHAVAAQRMIKALGTFGHQVAVKGDNRYLEAARRTVGRLRGSLPASEQTAPLAERMLAAGLLDDL
jgi:aminoglycoside/choline kinase family phosphotransferase